MSTVTSQSYARVGRWLALGFTGVILAAVVPASAAASGSDETTPVPNVVRPVPLPCDRLSPLPQCLPPVPTSTVALP